MGLGCANTFMADGDLRTQADSNNFILAYPQGIIRSKSSTEWDPDTDTDNINDSDLEFIKKLINQISSSYNIDATRIYVAGYSNGGMMAYGLGCKRSHLITAVGVVSEIVTKHNQSMFTITCDSHN